MLSEVLKKENVKEFFKSISKRRIYNEKEMPTTFNNERIPSSCYAFLVGIDAIIKYVIIIGEYSYFDKYLKQVEELLKKVNSHNEIKIGINKLLINFSKLKLQLDDIDSINNKQLIIKYIYQKYIVEGYVFHGFPSIFIDNVLTKGLEVNNYNYQLDNLISISKVFEKYNVKNVFSKNLEKSSYITITDSPFMGCFYAYNSPNYLKELCTGLIEKNNKYEIDSLFMKNYPGSVKNLKTYIKKIDMFNNDLKKLLDHLDNQWDLYNINESYPVMCMIKRDLLGLNSLKDIDNIIKSVETEELYVCVSKILDVKFNDFKVIRDIPSTSLGIVYLPKIDEIGYKALKKEKQNSSDFIDDYGNATILALAGLLLIAMALLISLIMIGR